jgi:hypothetical protein
MRSFERKAILLWTLFPLSAGIWRYGTSIINKIG